jgi:hypothetical protein
MNQSAIHTEPMEQAEVPVMTVWPSVARYWLSRFLGEIFANRFGWYVFTVGNLAALAATPIGLILYFWRVAQGISYRLTNRRVMEMRFADVRQAVALDGFDTIVVEQLPGQPWYQAGDLVFLKNGAEVLRLESVRHPESFRQTCWKSHQAHVQVRQALGREVVRAG